MSVVWCGGGVEEKWGKIGENTKKIDEGHARREKH